MIDEEGKQVDRWGQPNTQDLVGVPHERCSFCGASQTEVKYLIVDPRDGTAAICDQCVAHCARMIAGAEAAR